MSEPSLIKLQALTPTLLKRDSNTDFFQQNLKNFKNTLFYRLPPAAGSAGLRFPACNFVKKETPAKMFFCEFYKTLRTSFDRTPSDFCSLCLSEHFEKFFGTPLL